MSVLEAKVSVFSNFASLFSVMRHNSSVLFHLKLPILWTKGTHQSANFQTFDCSHENQPNSLCHFPSQKSVFLYILRFLLKVHPTPNAIFETTRLRYSNFASLFGVMKCSSSVFFGSTLTYFGFLSIELQFSSNFASLFSVMWDKSSVL